MSLFFAVISFLMIALLSGDSHDCETALETTGGTSLLALKHSVSKAQPLSAPGIPGTPQRSPKVLYMTLTFPSDELPVDLMVAHHQRMLSGRSDALVDTVVFNSEPPWLVKRRRDEQALQRLEAQRALRLVNVDYAGLDDPLFLDRFFVFDAHGNERPSLRQVLGNGTSHLKYAGSFEHGASNWLGMLNFLGRCLDAEASVELCTFMDSDIFLYRRKQQGVLDLAPGSFAQNDKWIGLEFPSCCSGLRENVTNGHCKAEQDTPLFSQRYMVLNRTRLAGVLPKRLEGQWHKFHRPFEQVWWMAFADQGLLGKMLCGGETFAMHPPPDLERFLLSYSEASFLDGQSATRGKRAATRMQIASALPELIQRMEEGQFNCHTHKATFNKCEDMLWSAERISSGMAW
mmetsp:Transcript_33940/g.59938  ORF Transcript_33940/g.59938 Transcript_33940/m.59938 type:complete len:402 (+) Transcript_33940:83-1288(+)